MFCRESRILYKVGILPESIEQDCSSLGEVLKKTKDILLHRPDSLEKIMTMVLSKTHNQVELVKFCKEISQENPVLGERLKQFLEAKLAQEKNPGIADMITVIHAEISAMSSIDTEEPVTVQNSEVYYPKAELEPIRESFFQRFPSFITHNVDIESLLHKGEVPGAIPFGILDAIFRFSFISLGRNRGKAIVENFHNRKHNNSSLLEDVTETIFQSFMKNVLPHILQKHEDDEKPAALSLILRQIKHSMHAKYGRDCTEREWAGFQRFLELMKKESEAHKIHSRNISMEAGVAKVAAAKSIGSRRTLMAEHIGYKALSTDNACITPGMDVYYFLKLYNQGFVSKEDILEVMCLRKFDYKRFAPVLFYIHPGLTVARQQYIEALINGDSQVFKDAKIKWDTEIRRLENEIASSRSQATRDVLQLMIRESKLLIQTKSREGMKTRFA